LGTSPEYGYDYDPSDDSLLHPEDEGETIDMLDNLNEFDPVVRCKVKVDFQKTLHIYTLKISYSKPVPPLNENICYFTILNEGARPLDIAEYIALLIKAGIPKEAILSIQYGKTVSVDGNTI